MTLLNAAALGFLALIPLIILFYILRAQYERVPVPSTLLWRNVVRDTEGRPTWRRPVRNILLLLQLLIALLGAFALARPATLGEAARNHILILDASSSMQATDVAPNRFEAAKRAAADLVNGAQDGDVFALIRTGNSIDVVEKTDNRAQMLRAIESLQPGVAGGDLRSALQVAGSIARDQASFRNQVVLFTDGAFAEQPQIESGMAELRVHTIGSSSDNQAVVHVRVRRIADGSNRHEGFARIFNYGAAPIEVPVRALADGIQIENRRMRLPARGASELIVPLQQNVKLFEVSVDRSDVLPIDNYAQVVVPNEEVELTLVSSSPQFLERALKAVPNVKPTILRPQQYRRDAAGAITIFEGFVPRSKDALPAGSTMFVNPPVMNTPILEVAELKQPQQVVRVNPRSPLLDAVDLTGVFLPKALRVNGPPGTSPVVESREAGLVWEGIDEGRKVVVFGFDPRQPEIGQRLAFPLMLANAISWLSPNAGSPTLAPGQTINLQPLREAKDLLVRDPNGKSYVFPVTEATRGKPIPFAQTEPLGRYAVLQRGEKGPLLQSWFTVNAGEETHSDVRPRAFPVETSPTALGGLTNAVNLEMWPYLVAAGLAILAAEWIFYARRKVQRRGPLVSISFLQPWALLLLPILLPFFFLLGRPRMARLPAWLRRAALGTRLAIVTLMVLALAQPLLGRTSETMSVVFAVDRSESISSEAAAQANGFIAQSLQLLDDKRRAGIVAFGREAAVERPISGPEGESHRVDVRGDGTSVAEAIRLARSMMPRVGGKKVVLLSDGRETLARADEEARAAANTGVQISVVPLSGNQPPEVLLEALEIAPQVREGEALDVVVAVGSTVETDVTIKLWLDTRLVSEQVVRVTPGTSRFTASQPALKKGFHTFWARVESPVDSLKQNNELSGFTVVKDKPRVLMIAPSEAEGRELRDALSGSEMQVELRPPTFIPPRLSAMKRYDALVLVNLPASAFSLDQMKTIQGYVQNLGGGLVAVGGENSFGLGEYAKTPLADVLPVTMNVPGKRDRGSVALMLIVDKSGSMDMREEGVTKMQMAREAAQVSLDSLDESDRIGVLAFDTQARWIIQPRRLGNATEAQQAKDRIRTIEASGGTEIYPALDMGFRAIREAPARYKHIILLTDGRSLSTAEYDRLIAQMRAEAVTLSTIAIGSDADTQLLEELAKQGEGRYYFVDKARDIPKVTTKEAKIASGSPMVEGTIQPKVLAPSPIVRGITPASIPPLNGYLVTTIKETGQTVLAGDEVRADPILAQWQYGLGRSVAWTSDLRQKWASAWLTWGEFRRFWAQAVRWTMPAPADPNLQTSVVLDGSNVIVRVDAVDDEGAFRDGQDIRVSILGQNVQISDQAMRQVAPGRYELTAPVDEQGVYSVDVSQIENGRAARTESTGFVVPYPAEYRSFGLDESFLGRLAAMTGGKILRDPRGVFATDGVRFSGLEWQPLWPWLFGAALVLFPFDIAMRRLQVPTELVARAFQRWAGLLSRRRSGAL